MVLVSSSVCLSTEHELEATLSAWGTINFPQTVLFVVSVQMVVVV